MVDTSFLSGNPPPSAFSGIQAAGQLQSLLNTQQTQADMQSAGQAAAGGDYQGGVNQLLSAGHFDEARQLRAQMDQMSTEDAKDQADLNTKMANAAQLAPPGQLNRLLAEIKAQHGGDTPTIDRMMGLPEDQAKASINALAGTAKEALDYKTAQMNQAYLQQKIKMAQFNAGTPYAQTIPGEEGQPPQTAITRYGPGANGEGAWSTPVPVPAGVNLGVTGGPLNAKGAGAKSSDNAVAAIKADYARANPGAPPLSDSAAISAATAITSKFNAGLNVTGWNKDASGNPTTPIYSAPPGTAAALRANQWNSDAVFARSRAQKSGGLQANNDQRATAVVPVLNHLFKVDQALDEPGAEDALGAVYGNASFQKYRGLMLPSDVQTPAEFGKIRQGLESAQAEVERVYTSGQGVVTDSERDALKGIIAEIKDVPNVAAAHELVQNARELIGGILETPTIQDVQANPQLAAVRQRGLAKITSFLSGTQVDPSQLKMERPAGLTDAQLKTQAEAAKKKGANPALIDAQLRAYGVQ